MRRFLGLFLLLSALLTGCSFFGPKGTDFNKLASAKVENPFFSIPPQNLEDYQKGIWILLAESKTKNWFYDPYSLVEDADGVVSFNTFVTERVYQDQLQPFNATSIGPYLQKIDCFGNYQWSQIFYAEQMPKQESYVNPLKPNQEWGWIKIKPKTSMAYIRARVCGRKYIDDQNVNYFLFQEGQMKFVKVKLSEKKTPPTPGELMVAEFTKLNPPEETQTSASSSAQRFPVFYEVINNTVTVIDPKKDIREMRVSSYELNKEFPKLADYVFRAHCQNKTYSFSVQGKSSPLQELTDSPESLPNVAFNRLCGDHGDYMKSSSSKVRK